MGPYNIHLGFSSFSAGEQRSWRAKDHILTSIPFCLSMAEVSRLIDLQQEEIKCPQNDNSLPIK